MEVISSSKLCRETNFLSVGVTFGHTMQESIASGFTGVSTFLLLLSRNRLLIVGKLELGKVIIIKQFLALDLNETYDQC